MADIERLKKALANAQQAGDQAAVAALSGAISKAEAPAPAPTAEEPRPMTADESNLAHARERGGVTQALAEAHNFLGSPIDAIVQGITRGAGDELAAAAAVPGRKIGALLTGQEAPAAGEIYDEALAAERGSYEQFREEHPYQATGGEILGSVMSAPAGIGKSLMGTLAKSVPLGIAEGAAWGFNTGEGGFANRAPNALVPAGVGGLASLFLPLGGAAVGRGLTSLAGRRAAEEVGTSPPAANKLREMVSEDAATAGTRGIAEAGEGAMLADVGPRSTALLDAALQQPGGRGAREAVEQRVAQGGQDVQRALDEVLAPVSAGAKPQQAPRAAETIRRAYDNAYQRPINYASPRGRQLEQLVRTRVPASAIKEANELMRIEGAKSKQILADVAEDGTVTFRQLPDVRQLDYITRGINQVVQSSEGKGLAGGLTQKGGSLNKLSKEIRSLLKSEVPAWERAVNLAADNIRQKQAKEVGDMLLSGRMTREEVGDALEGMGKAEVTKAREGVRQYVDDQMARVQRAMTDPNMDAREAVKALKLLSSRENRDKLVMLLGEQPADALFATVDKAAKGFDLRAALATNSKTYPRQVLGEAMTEAAEGGAVTALKQGRPAVTGQKLLQEFTGETADVQRQRQTEMAAEIARMLTERRGPEAEGLARLFLEQSARLPAEEALRRRMIGGTTGALRSATVPAGRGITGPE